ncbi:terminase [Methylobacterium aquaticum]|uniref:terminase n=1 Tax=Methylobacterium aquaticum TaxID=270351 RepID=UPI003D184B02
MAEHAGFQAAVDRFSDWRWRLNNLYHITDKDGRKVLFAMNWAQEALFDEMHYQNVILKARQLGFTTFIQIFMLDQAVFNTNLRAGTIAHTLDDAKAIFRDKIKFPYEHLPAGIREAVPIKKSSETELLLSNNSGVRVGVSLRGGTLQILHVSEYGKICAKFADKAREVRTGALNTVQAGQLIFIESTAEGKEGHFYDLTEAAQTKARSGTPLTPLDFRFHFYPWWKSPDYRLDPTNVVIPDGYARYFDGLAEKHGIDLDAHQRAWYAKKAEVQAADMKREYPSTPEEAFEAVVEGAYYGDQMAAAETQGRIGEFPALPGIPVNTAWDIGVGDYTAIWFFQIVRGKPRIVGFFKNTGEGVPYYAGELKRLAAERGWIYGDHFLPHDVAVKEWGTGKTRIEQLQDHGIRVRHVPALSLEDGIEAVRRTIPDCEFDQGPCADGLAALRSYRKEWDEERGVWLNRPRHDWASHGADAFRYLSGRYRDVVKDATEDPGPNDRYARRRRESQRPSGSGYV